MQRVFFISMEIYISKTYRTWGYIVHIETKLFFMQIYALQNADNIYTPNHTGNILPVEPTAQTAIGVTHESQSRGVSKLLLQTAPLLFTQTSHESGSEPGYDDDEHSNNVIWCTIDFCVLQFPFKK